MSPSKNKRALVKEELVELTGDYKKAIILNQFIYWSERVRDFDEFIKEENSREDMEEEIELRNGWMFKSAEELAEETMLGFSPATMRKHIKDLRDNGWIKERHNPKYQWDQTKQYRVDIKKIQSDLLEIGYSLEGYAVNLDEEPILNSKNATLENKNQDLESKNRTSENKNAIPETTSETTSETNNTYTQERLDQIKEIYQYWLDRLDDVNNAQLTENAKEEIDDKIDNYSVEDIKAAINHYNKIYRSDFYYSHNWTLQKFMKQSNGIPRFVSGLDQEHDGDLWKDYQQRKPSGNGKKEKVTASTDGWQNRDRGADQW